MPATKFSCPVCGADPGYLVDIGWHTDVVVRKRVVGAGIRLAGCRDCGSTDRERLVYLYLRDHLRLFREMPRFRILHIAPERLLYDLLRQTEHNYTCADLFVSDYDYAKDVLRMDIQCLDLPSNEFDVVICNHVLEHVVDDLKAIGELYRVLRPGGQAILQVPISNFEPVTDEDTSILSPREREIRFGQADHYRLYGTDYLSRLASAGFCVSQIDLSSRYPRFGLNPSEVLFVGTKS